MIKAAIVGLGWWGVTLVDSVAGSDAINFVAALTRSHSSRDQEFSAKHRLKLFNGMTELLRSPEIDAVVLATPPSGHPEQIVAAAAAGKHVFCEKPLALLKASADTAIEAVEAAGVTLGLGYNRRFYP